MGVFWRREGCLKGKRRERERLTENEEKEGLREIERDKETDTGRE